MRSAKTAQRQLATKRYKRLKRSFCEFCAVLWLISNAFGQAQDGNLSGSILDLTGAAVPNAKVEAESIATGVKTATTTDVSGIYRFNNLLVGMYRITASAPGFATAALNDVQAELNKT